jgi:Telomerase ribonucleoprotein complex - RNA binding domain
MISALEFDSINLDCQVYRYVVIVTNAVIPKSFWGTNSNFRLVLHSKHFLFISS